MHEKKTKFALEWPDMTSLSLEEGHLVARQAQAFTEDGLWAGKVYAAGEHSALALELARINRPRTSESDRISPASRARALVAFARVFGPLGQGRGVRKRGGAYQLDEVSWCMLHASALDFILTLNGALAIGRGDIVDYQLAALEKLQAESGQLKIPAGAYIVDKALIGDSATPRDIKVRQICEALINPNLGGKRGWRQGQQVVDFSTLFNLAYSQAAEWLVAGDFGRCDDCFSFFGRTDKRQRYCPALIGQSESRCAMRGRSRRRRNDEGTTASADDALQGCLFRQDNALPAGFKILPEPESE